MGPLISERCFVQLFEVATIVGEDRVLVGCCKLQLCFVGASKILSLPGGQHFKPVRTEKLCKEDRHIFVEVQPDEERGLGHRRRG